tara:strand:- start:296 stop:529 length:234 start_codon:yes stop_codon:yes gene_type:complete
MNRNIKLSYIKNNKLIQIWSFFKEYKSYFFKNNLNFKNLKSKIVTHNYEMFFFFVKYKNKNEIAIKANYLIPYYSGQ